MCLCELCPHTPALDANTNSLAHLPAYLPPPLYTQAQTPPSEAFCFQYTLPFPLLLSSRCRFLLSVFQYLSYVL